MIEIPFERDDLEVAAVQVHRVAEVRRVAEADLDPLAPADGLSLTPRLPGTPVIVENTKSSRPRRERLDRLSFAGRSELLQSHRVVAVEVL